MTTQDLDTPVHWLNGTDLPAVERHWWRTMVAEVLYGSDANRLPRSDAPDGSTRGEPLEGSKTGATANQEPGVTWADAGDADQV